MFGFGEIKKMVIRNNEMLSVLMKELGATEVKKKQPVIKPAKPQAPPRFHKARRDGAVNTGTTWARSEDDSLRKMTREGHTSAYIAASLKRTTKAVTARRYILNLDMRRGGTM